MALLSREVLFVTPALVQKNASRSRSKGDGDLMQYPSPRDLMAFLEKIFTGREDATFIVGRVHGGRYDPSNFGMRSILISSSLKHPLLRRFSPCCWRQFAACHISAHGLTSRKFSPRMICPCHDLLSKQPSLRLLVHSFPHPEFPLLEGPPMIHMLQRIHRLLGTLTHPSLPCISCNYRTNNPSPSSPLNFIRRPTGTILAQPQRPLPA
ncbi:hypothetical protein V8E53_002073, partial [Lactarius tabidus]